MTATRISPEASAFLARFAGELGALAGDLDRFQDALADMLSHAGSQPMPIQSQAVDELSQRAHALAHIAARMAEEGALESASIEGLIADVKLSALVHRLSEAGREYRCDEGGELLLFAS